MNDFWTEFSAGPRPVAAKKPIGAATIMASGTAGEMDVLFSLVDEGRLAAPQVSDDQRYTSHQFLNIF